MVVGGSNRFAFYNVKWFSPVNAEMNSFLVKAVDGSYYEYNSADLSYSYTFYQINPGSAGGKMYLHFKGLLDSSGRLIGLGDTVAIHGLSRNFSG